MKKRVIRKLEKGFTLLEVTISLVLIIILIEAMGGFFYHMYRDAIQLQNKIALNNSMELITTFIKEEICLADKIEIWINEQGENIKMSLGEGSSIEKGHLKKIRLVTGGEISYIELERVYLPTTGYYRLNYRANGTTSVISEFVEDITVYYKREIETLFFECKVQVENEKLERQKIVREFSASIIYKEK